MNALIGGDVGMSSRTRSMGADCRHRIGLSAKSGSVSIARMSGSIASYDQAGPPWRAHASKSRRIGRMTDMLLTDEPPPRIRPERNVMVDPSIGRSTSYIRT
jgi:hypothetical protein